MAAGGLSRRVGPRPSPRGDGPGRHRRGAGLPRRPPGDPSAEPDVPPLPAGRDRRGHPCVSPLARRHLRPGQGPPAAWSATRRRVWTWTAMLAELDWMAEHGFKGAQLANVNARPTPPLYDAYWDPYWAKCVELRARGGRACGLRLGAGRVHDEDRRPSSGRWRPRAAPTFSTPS